MLYHLLYPLHTFFSAFNVFRYITFRAAYAMVTALAISFLLGPLIIRILRKLEVYQVIREEFASLARTILDMTPSCADQTAALRKLRECSMAVNQTIACNE